MNTKKKALLIAASITIGWPCSAILAGMFFGGNVAGFVLMAPVVVVLFSLAFFGIFDLVFYIMDGRGR